MEMLEELKPKHIVEEGKIGNTKYTISDDYCVPQDEVPEILRRISREVQRALSAQYRKKQSQIYETKVS